MAKPPGSGPPETGHEPANDSGARTYTVQDQIGHLLRRAHQRATQIFLEAFEKAELTPTQWAALSRLHADGPLSQNHLGRLTAMDPATIQGVVRRLQGRGLVERADDPTDRRRTLLRVSVSGRDLVGSLTETALTVSSSTLEPLSPPERAQFLALLSKIS